VVIRPLPEQSSGHQTGSTDGVLGEYSHGGRIGVVVDLQGGSVELAKDIAMHIAASKPVCVDESGVPADLLEKERAILVAEASESGKPAEIVEKMVQASCSQLPAPL